MGEVYLVENVELQKELVIKVLLPDSASSDELVERFLAEARAAAAIRHRHIVEILDSSTLPDGRPYILMEYLEGETLFSFAHRHGPLDVEVVLPILAQVCSGLEAAHKRGVVHRDIKPSNIFITPQPDNPYFTKILDFGIAKLEDPTLAGGVMTRSVMLAGTPHYMSPEQARTLHGVDHRTDLYAVAVIAYEMLTGRVPYEAHSIGELVYQQARTTPPLVHELRPGVPDAWSSLLEQALSLEADQRPPSARDLALRMAAATDDGVRIAKEAAPLLFARADTTSTGKKRASSTALPMPVSEIRSNAPRPRRVSPTSPAASGRNREPAPAGRRATTGHARRTEILPDGEQPSRRLGSAFDQTVVPSPSQVAKAKPIRSAGGGTNPPVIYAPPPSAPPSAPATGLREQTSVVVDSTESGSKLRWWLIGLVLVAAIGAAIAIGLFTGPGKL